MTKFTRKLQKMSTHSYVLNIPKELVEKLGWRERQKISIEEGPRKTLVIKDAKKK